MHGVSIDALFRVCRWALQLGVKEAVISAGMALRASHAEAWAEDIPKLFGTLLSALPG